MADVLNFLVNRAFDINGDPAPGAQAFFYDSGTNDLRTVYADQSGEIPHPSPLVANAEGVFPPVFSSGGAGISVELLDEDGVMLDGYPMPLAVRVPGEGFNASGISFDPTGDIPATDVQSAIERVQQNLIQPLVDYGIGVTGNAPLLGNVNATDIASGAYRFENTTVGTFPSAINPAGGGGITLWRRNNSNCFMTLYPAGGSNVIYYRRCVASVWGDWSAVNPDFSTFDQAIAGTNNTTIMTPIRVEQHMQANALGWTQRPVDVQSQRNAGTVYTNDTVRPIYVSVSGQSILLQSRETASSPWVLWSRAVGDSKQNQTVIVPVGQQYRVASGSVETWVELR